MVRRPSPQDTAGGSPWNARERRGRISPQTSRSLESQCLPRNSRPPERREASRHVSACLSPLPVLNSRRRAPVRTIPKAHSGEQTSTQFLRFVVAAPRLDTPRIFARCRTALLTATLALTLVAGGIIAGQTTSLPHVVTQAVTHLVAAPIARVHPFPNCPGGASPCP